jgi:two-component system, NtrC family, sensor kinase
VRSLSVRILLAFAAVILTFGVTTVIVVSYIGEFGVEIGVVKTGFLPLALNSKDFARRQEDLSSYLAEDLQQEESLRTAKRNLLRNRKERDRTLRETMAVIKAMDNVPTRHQRRLAEATDKLQTIENTIDKSNVNYTKLLLALPLSASPSTDAVNHQAALSALQELISAEKSLVTKANELARYLQDRVTASADSLEGNERKLRLYTIGLATFAIVVGIVLAIWATLAFRPLLRLRDAASKIAAGDYGSRIEERGPREVADLAREFNSMGRAVQDRERELVRSERLAAMGKMAQLITHEVRNPLSSIALNTELLEEELSHLPAGNEATSLCQSITREVDRLTAITEEYLEMGRLPKPRLELQDIFPLIRSLADFVAGELASRGVSLQVCDTPTTPILVQVDGSQLRQCLLNLVRNASEAVSGVANGFVQLGVEQQDSLAVISVQDNGPGISEDLQARIFEPFFTTKKGGSGLGLALTQQIITDHGGTIQVAPALPTASAGTRGALFLISLPVVPR